jgi:hypothetical protein
VNTVGVAIVEEPNKSNEKSK